MKKLLKRIMALSLCVCMITAFTLNASAATDFASNQDISLAPYTSACINVYGNDTIENNRNVCIWTEDGTTAQKWKYQTESNGYGCIKSLLNTRYALNVDRRSSMNWNCDVYEYSGNEADASIQPYYYLNMYQYDGYTLKLVNWDKYLYADSQYNNANIHWVDESVCEGSPYYVWDINVNG